MVEKGLPMYNLPCIDCHVTPEVYSNIQQGMYTQGFSVMCPVCGYIVKGTNESNAVAKWNKQQCNHKRYK